MSKALRYAQLVLSIWPQVRSVVQSMRNRPLPHGDAITAGVAALAAIFDELDAVESGKKLAKRAQERVLEITSQFKANDAAIDKLIDEKFPK